MPNEPKDTTFIDPNTDNLDDFSDLINGKAEIKEDDVELDEVKSVDENEDTEEKDQDVEDEASDEDSDSEDEPELKPKKVNRFQERINELTAKAREAERALEALKAATATKQDEPEKAATSFVRKDEPSPDALNPDGSDKYPLGEFDPQYIRDMARHTIEEEWNAKKEQEAAEQSRKQNEAARAEIQEKWVEKLTPITEQHEDFLDKTLELESAFEGLDPNYSDYLVQTIKSLDHGPEVLYYFANNLDEAQKFVRMGPLNATLALGEINAMFKGQTRKEPKVSKAPPPPQVNKGAKTRAAVNADTDDLDAFSSLLFNKNGR